MNVSFTVYERATGRITLNGGMPLEQAEAYADAQHAVLIGHQLHWNTHYVDVASQTPVAKGQKPSDHYEWDFTIKGWKPNVTLAWQLVRTKRDELLAATDWTQLPDVAEATKNRYTDYRQALRDITNQPDPASIVWPVLPT